MSKAGVEEASASFISGGSILCRANASQGEKGGGAWGEGRVEVPGEKGGGVLLAVGAQRAAGSPEALGEGSLGMSDQGICARARRCWGGRAGRDLEVVSGEERGRQKGKEVPAVWPRLGELGWHREYLPGERGRWSKLGLPGGGRAELSSGD